MTSTSAPAHPPVHRIGSTTVQKIWETDLNGMTFGQLLPGLDDLSRHHHPFWFPDGTHDGEGHAFMSVHSWLVHHNGQVILVDAGVGNDKQRPQQMVFDRLASPFLDRLRAAGVAPEEVDVVLVTHIHSDHVGWNTRLENGLWEPTFPNARIVLSDVEYAYGLALTAGDDATVRSIRDRAGLGKPVRTPLSGTFADSIMPLSSANIRQVSVEGSEVLPGIRFLPTPGHSIDHASIELTSDGDTALFPGDVFHHAVEVFDPDLVSTFCEFPDASRSSRRWLLDHAATTRSTIFSSHFPRSSVGKIARKVDGFEWNFV